MFRVNRGHSTLPKYASNFAVCILGQREKSGSGENHVLRSSSSPGLIRNNIYFSG